MIEKENSKYARRDALYMDLPPGMIGIHSTVRRSGIRYSNYRFDRESLVAVKLLAGIIAPKNFVSLRDEFSDVTFQFQIRL